jgi:hypothetical protein
MLDRVCRLFGHDGEGSARRANAAALPPAKVARARRLRGSLFALLLVGLVVPALAWAEWSAPVDLSAAGQNAGVPQVAVDAGGNAVFTWQRFDGANWRIQARARSATGTLSAVQTLSKSGQDAFGPEVGVDADGNAVFTWQRSDGVNNRVQARARAATGALSVVQNLSDPGADADLPEVAVDADGDAVFTWRRFDGANARIQARARSATGTLSAVQNVSDAGQNASQPAVAVDPGGDAVLAWRRFDGANNRVQARARSAAGTLSAVKTLSSSGRDADSPEVAVDTDGDAVFTWTRFDGANERVQARARSTAGTLSAVQNLSDPGRSAFTPQVAVDSGGDAVFTWRRFDGANERAQARARSATGTLSAVQTLSDPGRAAFFPQVAVDTDGDAVFAWARSDGFDSRIEARSRSASGTLRPLTILSDPGQDASFPDVAVDPGGDALVTWARSDGAHERVQASAGP